MVRAKPIKKSARASKGVGSISAPAKPSAPIAASPMPAPSPAPEVIDLLRKVDSWRSIPDAEKHALLASIRIILSTWDANQDPKEIAAMLGLAKRRKKAARRASS